MSITDKDIDTIRENIDGVLFFAGEHTDPVYYGSLHAAYNSGIRVGNELLTSVNKNLHRYNNNLACSSV